MKTFAVIQKDKTILVKTPVPYVVDTYKDVNPDILEDTRYKLSQSTKFLYDCLRVLRIPKKVAVEKRYTLNLRTGDQLSRIARDDERISFQMYKLIRTYDW